MNNFIQWTIALVNGHREWTMPIVFVLSFCESFAFVSLVVPATAILLGLGALLAAARLHFWPLWIAAALGAFAGDWLAYDLAFRFKDPILRVWPFSRHPALVESGINFFGRWGIIAVFGGRFLGPLRAIVPIVAGIYAMPWLQFQIANCASAVLWAFSVLTPGFLGVHWLAQ